MRPFPTIITKEYKNNKAFNRDAPKMTAQGYRVASVNSGKSSMNFFEILASGQLFLSKKRVIVTYQLN